MYFLGEKWKGDEKLILAIDIGTTQSCVTYSYLTGGAQLKVRPVNTWPGQLDRNGEAKVPTLIWYNSTGATRLSGAEAHPPQARVKAAGRGWHLAEQFKLHLHPESMRRRNKIAPPPLPPMKTVKDVYADWFKYLYKHTREFFQSREFEGEDVWTQLEPSIEFVIAHPNGWSLPEQQFLREAMTQAGFVSDDHDAKKRVCFVSEAEASVHYLVHQDTFGNRLKRRTKFLVCDAGGSTVDTTLYEVVATDPELKLHECRASACIQAGGIFVNHLVSEYFRGKFSAVLHGEELSTCVDATVESFEREMKRSFDGSDQYMTVAVDAARRWTEKSIDLYEGLMHIKSTDIKNFFKPCFDQIIESVKDQMQGHDVKHIMLVGGFGDSPYLQQYFRETFNEMKITTSNEPNIKAVAYGAVIWHLKQSVKARAVRFTYGTDTRSKYQSFNSDHQGRRLVKQKDGKFVTGVWDPIIPKDTVIEEGQEIRRPLWNSYSSRKVDLSDMHINLYAFESGHQVKQPSFVLDDDGNVREGFHIVCNVQADMSGMERSMKVRWSLRGRSWLLNYEVAMFFGGTELRACILWKEKSGEERRGPAVILPKSII